MTLSEFGLVYYAPLLFCLAAWAFLYFAYPKIRPSKIENIILLVGSFWPVVNVHLAFLFILTLGIFVGGDWSKKEK